MYIVFVLAYKRKYTLVTRDISQLFGIDLILLKIYYQAQKIIRDTYFLYDKKFIWYDIKMF